MPNKYNSLSRFEIVRSHNEQRILNALIDSKIPLTRVELSKLTNLTKPTVNLIARDLEKNNLISAVGNRPGLKGRSPTLYQFNPEVENILAVDISSDTVRLVLADLLGRIVEQDEFSIIQNDSDYLIEELSLATKKLLKDRKTPTEIVVGIPGVVDNGGDEIKLPPNILALKDKNFVSNLRKIFPRKVTFGHDINLAALGEMAQGAAIGMETFVFLFLDRGVGMGLVLNGELFTGHSGFAGEVGFLSFGADPLAKNKSERGTLEEQVSTENLQVIFSKLKSKYQTSLGANPSVDQIILAADSGDQLARAVLDQWLEPIALLLLSITSILNPEAIILGGALGLSSYLRTIVHNKIEPRLPFHVEIIQSSLGKRATILGAVATALTNARSNLQK
jgi:predicted NBD/HSP70 family sugar kinase